MGIVDFVLVGDVVVDLEEPEEACVGSWGLRAFSATARSHLLHRGSFNFNVNISSKHAYINKIALSFIVYKGDTFLYQWISTILFNQGDLGALGRSTSITA